MKMIVLSAALALGLGIAGASTASAANEGTAVKNATTIDMSARCWWRNRCWHGAYSHRHCENVRVCDHYHY